VFCFFRIVRPLYWSRTIPGIRKIKRIRAVTDSDVKVNTAGCSKMSSYEIRRIPNFFPVYFSTCEETRSNSPRSLPTQACKRCTI